VFVTGATGLLGNNLVRGLRAEGHTVRALVRSQEKGRRLLGDTGAELIVGDMADVASFSGALVGCEVVFHTAAYFREFYGPGDHTARLDAINVQGTLALGEAARACGVRRLVHTSSSGTIGFRADGSPGDEDTPPPPIAGQDGYFRSKVVIGQRLAELAARSRLDVVQVLPGWMFGPGDAAPTATGRLVLAFLAGKLPAIPPGGCSAVDARDVATGMIRTAELGRAGEKYILTGPFVTVAEVAALLAQITGLPAPRTRIPYPVAVTYALLSQAWARITGGRTLVTLSGVRFLQARLQASSAKAERELGWRRRPLQETLRDEVAWFRAQGMSPERVAGARPVTA
jgi:dihydroflavonol-4-reductase